MKILFDSPRIFSFATGDDVGGAERQQWLLARALAQRGHEVIVYNCSSQSTTPSYKRLQIEKVNFRWSIPSDRLRAWPKILAKERPDWWYWRGHDYYLGYVVPLAHYYSTKVVFAVAFDTDCQPLKALTRRTYLWPLYGLGMWMADRILIQHELQRQMLPKLLRSKAHWVPSIAGKIYPVTNRENYVCWIGVLREPKRPHLIVEIAKRLPDVRFVVCGPTSIHRTRPEYANEIVRHLRSCSNIEYRGQVSPEEAQKVISHAALLLSTANQEGFPNTFLQAWGASVPVISLGIDPGAVINLNSSGIVTNDIETCAKEINNLIENHALNRELGLRGYNFVNGIHSESQSVSLFLDALFI